MEILREIFTEAFWYISTLLVTATIALAGVINGALKIKKDALKVLVSWLIAAALTAVTWALHLIEFGDPVWLGFVMLAIIVGLAANRIYSIDTIKAFIKSWFPDKTLDNH